MKDKLVPVAEPATLEAIERNDFHSPVPVEITPDGVWVYQWSLEQYKVALNEQGGVSSS